MEGAAVEEAEMSGAVEDPAVEDAEVSGGAEFAPALVAAHPFGHSVAVAVGPDLRVFDLLGGCAVSLSDDSGGCAHTDAIRAITFGAGGALFASAGDDKLVKVWKTGSWRCIRTITSEKRVSTVAFSNDGLSVTFADKFGVIWLVSLGEDGEGQVSADSKPLSIFGHYCSIITSMKFSPDGQFIATADRDFKIRVTSFPKNPMKGATEIQSFCLGHTEFVSCIAFTCISGGSSFLLSGGGDSTVRLWDHINGCLLDTYDVRDKVGELSESNETEDSNLAIADICLANDNSLVAVAIQSLNGMMLLACDLVAKKLSFLKVIRKQSISKITTVGLMVVHDYGLASSFAAPDHETVIRTEKSYIPTSLASSCSEDLLWTVMGASNMPNQSASQLLTRVRIIPWFQKDAQASADHDAAALEDNEVPHGEKLLLALQGSLDASKQEEVLSAVLAALKVSMHKMLVKKNYSEERREQRKRGRNDKKIKK